MVTISSGKYVRSLMYHSCAQWDPITSDFAILHLPTSCPLFLCHLGCAESDDLNRNSGVLNTLFCYTSFSQRGNLPQSLLNTVSRNHVFQP